MILDASVFDQLFRDFLRRQGRYWRPSNFGPTNRARKFRSYYGMDYQHCAILWNKLYEQSTDNLQGWKPKNLLDALFFLRVYASEEVNAGFAGCDEKTLRKWNWKVLGAIADLNCIDFAHRNRNDNGSICRITLDGTDFRIQEPLPFDKRWFSHKFKGAGVRYEVGICIQTGEIVWVNGPFSCGSWPDLRIARNDIIYLLDPAEKILADGGYADGDQFFVVPDKSRRGSALERMKATARARHETINRKFKEWNVLSRVFRHSVEKHGMVFMAVANITHLLMSVNAVDPGDAGLFQVYYKDN